MWSDCSYKACNTATQTVFKNKPQRMDHLNPKPSLELTRLPRWKTLWQTFAFWMLWVNVSTPAKKESFQSLKHVCVCVCVSKCACAHASMCVQELVCLRSKPGRRSSNGFFSLPSIFCCFFAQYTSGSPTHKSPTAVFPSLNRLLHRQSEEEKYTPKSFTDVLFPQPVEPLMKDHPGAPLPPAHTHERPF